MKVRLFLRTVLLIMLVLFLSSCANKDSSGERTSNDYEPIVTEAGEFPIVEEEVTLDVLTVSNSLVENFETNEFTKWYEEKTGVKVNWEVVPEEGVEEQLNLILTSGDYPDVIMDMPVTTSQMRIYGEKGVFLSLNNLIEDYGIETKRMFEEMPIVEDSITTPEGEIYALPQVNVCYHCTMPEKMWINQPWLDELGLDMPTTTEEFHDVLKAFKEDDPNGNGKADEIPLSGMKDSWREKITGFLMEPFIYSELHEIDGKIIAPWDKPERKEGLEYIHGLYEDGLIYEGSFTQDMEQFKKIGENPDEIILGAATAATLSTFLSDDISEDSRMPDYVAVPPLEGPKGKQNVYTEPDPVTRPAEFIITNKAEHPDVAFRWADAMYDHDITKRSVNGRKGEEWVEAEEGDIGLDGEPATWKTNPDAVETKTHNNYWDQTGPSYRPKEYRDTQANDPNSMGTFLQIATEVYDPYVSDTVNPVPELFFSSEQSEELAKIESSLEDHIEEMEAKFIVGDADLDKEWDEYLETLKNIGLDDYVSIYQEAYDEKYK